MVSVIIPVYNAAKQIGQCIDSVIHQTYKDFEIILVNDGSTDNSEEVCMKYCSEQIHYIFQENAGPGAARNKGLTAASGDYICFLDSDDYLVEDALERMISRFDEETDIVCGCCIVDKGDSVEKECFFDSDYTMETPLEKTRLYLQLMDNSAGQPERPCYTAIGVPWGKLYRRRMLEKEKLTFNVSLRRMQDNIFNMYAFASARKVVYLNYPVVLYRIEHLKTVSYLGYQIYEGVLRERDSFFEANPEYYNKIIRRAHIHEKADALFQALKKEMIRSDGMPFQESARTICHVPYFEAFILSRDSNGITKMKLIKICYWIGNYALLEIALKLNMKNCFT